MKRKFYLRGLGIGILVTAVIMGIASGRNRQMTDEEIKARAKELGMVESTVLSNMTPNSPQSSVAPSQAPVDTPAVSASLEDRPEASVSPSDSPKPSASTENDGKDSAENSSPAVSSEVDKPTVSPSPKPSTPKVSSSPEPSTPKVSSSPENTPKVSASPSISPEASTPTISPSPENTPEVSAGETITITIRSGQSSVAVSKMLEEAGLVESASAYDKFLCENGYDKRLKSGSHQIPVGASEEEIARIITSRAD